MLWREDGRPRVSLAFRHPTASPRPADACRALLSCHGIGDGGSRGCRRIGGRGSGGSSSIGTARFTTSTSTPVPGSVSMVTGRAGGQARGPRLGAPLRPSVRLGPERAGSGVRVAGTRRHGRGPGGAARGSDVTPARRPFLVLPVGFTLADVRWLACGDLGTADPEAQLDADLRRDGQRRRWLGAGVAGPS